MNNANAKVLKLNAVETSELLTLVLSAVRSPEQKLGKRIDLKQLQDQQHVAQDMRFLESLGYRRNTEINCFELPKAPLPCPFDKQPGPVIRLKDNDPRYVEKMLWAESQGYSRNTENDCWEIKQTKPMITIGKRLPALLKRSSTAALMVTGIAIGIFLDSI